MKSKGNFFIDYQKFKTIDTQRLACFMAFLLVFAITEIGREIYRPYIYENNINDFGLADSIGNLGGIIVQIFLGLTIFNPPQKKGLRIIAFFILGYILYEVLQPILPKGVFDWKDILGTIVGGAIGTLLFLLMHKVIRRNKVFHQF